MSLRIKGTTLFQFSCCAWGCQTDLLKERKKRFSGWELCVSLWSEGLQNIHTERSIPAEQSNSSSGLDKVYIMICKVLWEGGGKFFGSRIYCHPPGGFLFLPAVLPDSVLLFRSLYPIVLFISQHWKQVVLLLNPLKVNPVVVTSCQQMCFSLIFWFAVLFPSMLNALVSAVQQLEASLFELFITSLAEEFSHISGMQWIQE